MHQPSAKPGQIVLSAKVRDLANVNSDSSFDSIKSLNQKEDKFLNSVVTILEDFSSEPAFGVTDFSSKMGMSKSKLYRQMTALIDLSPNEFLKEFKLRKAMRLIAEGQGNISEVAFESGFNSLSYFSKCFQERFALLPSEFADRSLE